MSERATEKHKGGGVCSPSNRWVFKWVCFQRSDPNFFFSAFDMNRFKVTGANITSQREKCKAARVCTSVYGSKAGEM